MHRSSRLVRHRASGVMQLRPHRWLRLPEPGPLLRRRVLLHPRGWLPQADRRLWHLRLRGHGLELGRRVGALRGTHRRSRLIGMERRSLMVLLHCRLHRALLWPP
jgi:hypothetical protein